MIKEIQTILWKEWKEFFFQQSGRSKFRLLIAFGIIGILFPFQRGANWFHLHAFMVTGFIGPLLMTTGVVCDLFAGERERHTLETLLASRLSDKGILLGKLLSAMSYAFVITLLIVLLNIITVNIKYYNGNFIIFSAQAGLIITALNIILALLGALIGAIVSLKVSSLKQAQQTLSISIVVLVILPVFLFNMLPGNIKSSFLNYFHSVGMIDSVLVISAVLLIISLLLLAYMFSRFKRVKLFME